MNEPHDTVPSASEETPAPTLEAVLLRGLTAMGDESAALSVIDDACQELTALSEIIGLELTGEPLDRPALTVLIDGIERRLRAGLVLLRRERDAAPGGAS